MAGNLRSGAICERRDDATTNFPSNVGDHFGEFTVHAAAECCEQETPAGLIAVIFGAPLLLIMRGTLRRYRAHIASMA